MCLFVFGNKPNFSRSKECNLFINGHSEHFLIPNSRLKIATDAPKVFV